MRHKNESIYQFILDEDRKRNRRLALREKSSGAQVKRSAEHLSTHTLGSLNVLGEPHNETVMSLVGWNQPARDEHESACRESDDSRFENCEIEPLYAGVLRVEQKPWDFRISLGMSILTVTGAFVSIIALLWLDTIVNQDLYSHGLQFSLAWATPYWTAVRTALSMLWLIAIATVLFNIYLLRRRHAMKDEKWKRYTLADGTKIALKIETVVKSVKRLKENDCDGKPTYSIETDNVVEVAEEQNSAI